MSGNEITVEASGKNGLVTQLIEHAEPELVTLQRGTSEKAEVIVLPDGKQMHCIKQYLDEYLSAPERRTGTAKLESLDSFIEHVNRHKHEDSVLFARTGDIEDSYIQCIFDYNPNGGNVRSAAYMGHRANYYFPYSQEWKTWQAQNKEVMSQADFAAFIEDNIADVAYIDDGFLQTILDSRTDLSVVLKRINPDSSDNASKLKAWVAGPNKLIELSRGLAVHESSAVKNAQNLQTGEAQIQFESEHQDADGKPIRVPGFFLLHIPVLDHGEVQTVLVRLRYRLRQGSLLWFFELYRPDLMVRAALTESIERAAGETELTAFLGVAEKA